MRGWKLQYIELRGKGELDTWKCKACGDAFSKDKDHRQTTSGTSGSQFDVRKANGGSDGEIQGPKKSTDVHIEERGSSGEDTRSQRVRELVLEVAHLRTMLETVQGVIEDKCDYKGQGGDYQIAAGGNQASPRKNRG